MSDIQLSWVEHEIRLARLEAALAKQRAINLALVNYFNKYIPYEHDVHMAIIAAIEDAREDMARAALAAARKDTETK